MIILNILLLLVGFVLLIKGADIFVDGASSTAENFGVSKMLIGLTIIAFGTSAPEFAVSVSAFMSGKTDMILGNVIGSCILNILLILGLAAVIRPLRITDNTIRKEIPLCMLISALLVVLFLDNVLGNGPVNQITREDGLVIILFFSVFLYYLVSLAVKRKPAKNKMEATEEVEAKGESEEKGPKFGLGKSLLFVAVGLVGIVIGSQLVVDNASAMATAFGMSERLIALTIVAFGTSLPELVTTVVAGKKGEQELAVGNIIGSNIFNICIVLGVPVLIFGAIVPVEFQMIDLFMLIASAVILFLCSVFTKKITRSEGVAMLAIFAIYYGLIMFL